MNIKIVIISGTTREGRASHNVAKAIFNQVNTSGNTAHLVDVKESNLPLMEYQYAKHPNPTEEMKRLHNLLEEADSFILVSPEYNGFFTGALKNTMDYFYTEYFKKVMGVCSVSAGGMGGIRAALNLQQQVLFYGAYPLPRMLTIGSVNEKFAENGDPNQDVTAQIDKYLEEFCWLSEAVYNQKNK